MKSRSKIVAVAVMATMAILLAYASTMKVTSGEIDVGAKQDEVRVVIPITKQRKDVATVKSLVYRFDGPVTNTVITFYASDLGVNTEIYSKSNSTENASGRVNVTNDVFYTSAMAIGVKTVETNNAYKVHWAIVTE